MAAAELDDALEEAGHGRHAAHVARHGLDDHRGDLRPAASEKLLERRDVVVASVAVCSTTLAGTPAESGLPNVAGPLPALTKSASEWPW